MPQRKLPQEVLKLIACATMLLDHIGAVLVLDCFSHAGGESRGALLELYELLRTVGRLAFPIYCFLLVEGHIHTRDAKRYGLRLLVTAVLSELPYDLALCGGINWQRQSVMVTLLLGFLMLEVMDKCPKLLLKLLAMVPFAILAELLETDYGADGILTIALFALTRGLPHAQVLQFFGLWFIFSPNHGMMLNWLGGLTLTTQELAVLSIVPIALYDGRKVTTSKAFQWSFYLFYPAHLLLLYFVRMVS